MTRALETIRGVGRILSRSPFATFHAEPGLTEAAAVMATSFFVLPFGSVAMPLHQRRLYFEALSSKL